MAYQEQDACGRLWETKLTTNDSTPVEGAGKLGAVRVLGDGRAYRYMKMTGTDGLLGNTYMPATLVSVTDATAASGTGPDGATTTIITDSDAAFTVDAYINWYFKVTTAMTGTEEALKIVGNSATTLTLEKSITTTLAAGGTDDGEILAGNATGMLSTASDSGVSILGIGIGTLTENYYGWVQVRGIGSVISTAALTEGASFSSGGATTAGQAADRAGADDNYLGVTIAAGGTNDYQLVDIKIA